MIISLFISMFNHIILTFNQESIFKKSVKDMDQDDIIIKNINSIFNNNSDILKYIYHSNKNILKIYKIYQYTKLLCIGLLILTSILKTRTFLFYCLFLEWYLINYSVNIDKYYIQLYNSDRINFDILVDLNNKNKKIQILNTILWFSIGLSFFRFNSDINFPYTCGTCIQDI